MQKKSSFLIVFILILLPIHLFSQTTISSSLQTTYGNNKHTNRDNLLFTLKDSEDNIYLIGTTENDFTFNDIKIIKLNKNIEVIWERELSFEHKLSYDNVADAFLDSNNDLILVCKAAYTSSKQTVVIVKYSKDGEKLWDYPFSEVSNPINFDFSIYYSFLDSNDNLHITYRPLDPSYLKYHFLTFSSSGDKIEDFSRDDLFRDLDHGYIYNNKLTYINGVYNMIYKIELDESPYQKFKLFRFNKDISELFDIDMDEETTNFINTPFAETYTTLKGDKNGDLVFVIPYYSIQKDYMVINFNTNGSIRYTLKPDPNKDKFLIEYTFDSQNNLIILSNNRTSNTNEELALTIQKYNNLGELIYYKSDPDIIGKAPFFNENHISVYTDNGKIITYDYDLNRLNQIEIEPFDAYSFTPNSIVSIGENSFLTGTTHNINYSGSDFLSEMDFIVRKTDNIKEIDAFTYTGLGTSRALILKSIQIIDNNYVVALTEELGPHGYYAGGSAPPINKYILKYDKELNLINEEIVDDNDIIVEIEDAPEKTEYIYTTAEGDTCIYRVENDYKSISFYKNNNFKWTRNLSLTGVNQYEQAVAFTIDNFNNFIVSSTYDGNYNRLHRITSDNNYEFIDLEFSAYRIIPMTNGWFLTNDPEGNIRILSEYFSLINKGPVTFDPIDSHFIEKNNKFIYWIEGEKYIWILNQFGEIEEYFEMDIVFHSNFYTYDGNNLLYLKSIGYSIYLHQEYSWTRASIEKFNLDLSYLIDDIVPKDTDNDGIDDSIDQCRNTTEGAVVNQYGCSSSQILAVDGYESIDSKITLYPNPTLNCIYLKTHENTRFQSIKIFDPLGKEIKSFENPQNTINYRIDLSNLTEGIYFIKMNFENGRSSTKKFILK